MSRPTLSREQKPPVAWWKPRAGTPTAFVDTRVFEVVHGGVRGGGKTDAALGDFAGDARLYKAAARGVCQALRCRALE